MFDLCVCFLRAWFRNSRKFVGSRGSERGRCGWRGGGGWFFRSYGVFGIVFRFFIFVLIVGFLENLGDDFV